MHSLAGYIRLLFVCLFDLFPDSFNQPSLVSDWIGIVRIPVHAEVIAKEKEWLKKNIGNIIRS